VTNFCVETLTNVLLSVSSQRTEYLSVAKLKPSEGLLVGLANLFKMLPISFVKVAVVHVLQACLLRKQKMQQGVSRACGVMNDLEVAIHHIQQFDALLNKCVEKGFPLNTHETEQLVMCVKTLTSVADSFRVASDSAIELLESVLRPRIRSIVGDAVGGSDTSTFMGASSAVAMVGGGKACDRVMVRMNYNHLDEETYN